MLGYRSIGERELLFLINSHNPVYGQNILSDYIGCGCKNANYGMVSFFKEPYRWKDSSHQFDIVVNLKNDVEEGVATYMASKDFGKTKVWTGRTGKFEYKINELYTRFYNPEDIIEINIGSHYTDGYVLNRIIPFCKKFHVTLIREVYDFKSGKQETYRLKF